MKGKKKLYDRIFKENAVKLSYQKGSTKQCANELGIFHRTLTRWRQDYKKFGTESFQGPGHLRVHPDNRLSFELEKKSKESELKFEILKNAAVHLYKGKLIIYQFISDNQKKYTITQMCKVLEVGYGTYIIWKNNGISAKQKYIALLKKDITSIFFNFKRRYGKKEVSKELHKLGYIIAEKRVYFYMRQLGLKRVAKRKFKTTTDSNHNHYIAPNVLDRNFTVDAPSKVWVSDITYLQTNIGFLYLTVIMDLFDRKIIGWSLSNNLFACNTSVLALEMAVTNRKGKKGLIFHSDRGVQYASKIFTDKLNSYQFTRSMSRKGNYWDNAVSESFFNSLKRELIHRNSKLITPKVMTAAIFEFIENWYNKARIHSALNDKTIEQFNSLNNQVTEVKSSNINRYEL